MTIYLPYKDQKVGLGGIGKGYAVDIAFDYLKNKVLVNYSVNGSGDMRVHSHQNAPRPWSIGIRYPLSHNKNQSAGLVQIVNGSVSTSGSYIQNKNNSHTDHHIVSKYKSKKIPISSTVIGETCLETDVWATIAMALSIEESLKLLNREGLQGVLIDNQGQTHLTKKALERFGQV